MSSRLFSGVRKTVDAFVTILFILLVIIVFIQVLFRYVFQNALPWADEASRYCFIWLIYIGGSITVRKGMNITFDILLDSLPEKIWKIVFLVVNLCCMVFLTVVIYLGAILCRTNLVQSSSILHLNMGLVMLAIPIGAVLMLVEQIFYCIGKLKEGKDPVIPEIDENSEDGIKMI